MVDGTYARPHHADPSVSVAFIAKTLIALR